MRTSSVKLSVVKSTSTSRKPPLKGAVCEAYHVYLNSLAPSGRAGIQSLLVTITQLLGYKGQTDRFPWNQIDYQQMHQILALLKQKGYAVGTINLAMAGCRGVCRTAFNMGIMDAQIFMRMMQVKLAKGSVLRKGRALTTDEIRAVIKVCQDEASVRSTRDLALVYLGIAAGLRKSELLSVMVEDFDIATGSLKVLKGKGNKERQIFLAEEASNAIEDWIKRLPEASGKIYRKISKSNTVLQNGLSAQGVTTVLQNLRQRAKIAPFSAHDLRRTFITRLLENGVDMNVIRQLAGHSDLATTARYDRREDSILKMASVGIKF